MDPELYHTDCFHWLLDHASHTDPQFDLVYCDPPFFTQRNLGAFGDRWASLDEYLRSMAMLIELLHSCLQYTGSLWLHCDQHASHYIKCKLDEIFGHDCFRNEVIWRYRRWPSKSGQLQRMHDAIFWYSRKPQGYTFNELYEPLSPSTLATFGKRKQKADFSYGHSKPSTLEESPGTALSDVWEIPIVAPSGHERTGYPTQKPKALLERIIRISSNTGDLVLDPMCGSGTTLAVATRLGRHAVGIDESAEAIRITTERLTNLTKQKEEPCQP